MNCLFWCEECGHRYVVGADGVSRHMDGRGRPDHDSDSDHAAYGEEPADWPEEQGDIQ